MSEWNIDRSRSARILIDLRDVDGNDTGRAIPVTIEYDTLVDPSYGADADGNRSVARTEYVYRDCRIAVEDLLTLNSAQVEQLVTEAKAIFEQKGPRP